MIFTQACQHFFLFHYKGLEQHLAWLIALPLFPLQLLQPKQLCDCKSCTDNHRLEAGDLPNRAESIC